MKIVPQTRFGCCIRAVLAMSCGLPLAPHAQAAPPSGAGWHLAWNDEFEGSTLDTSKWRHWLLGKRRDAINSPSAVSLANGNLTISTYTSGGVHHTGMISTQNTYQYTYGYIEARIQYTSAPGMWSAFWMQSDTMGNPIGSPNSAGTEIDICEHRSINSAGENINDLVVGNLHWDGYGSAKRSTGYTSPKLGLGTGFHTYGMEWTPTQHKFYIDGTLRWTVNNASFSPVSQRSEFIILSSEVDNGSWAGSIPTNGYGTLATTTTKMEVDYVRVYRRAETVVNGDLEGKTSPFTRVNQASWSSTNGRTAPASASLAPTSSAGASIEQSLFGILPNTGYTLTAWGNAGTTSPSLSVGAKNHGNPQTTQLLTSASYTRATVPFTTGLTQRSATVFAKSNNSGSVAYVDDFLVRRHATVNNGQLESGTNDAWNSTYGGSTISKESTYDGDFAWKIPASNSSAGVEQEIVGLTPFTTYRLSSWTTNGNSGLTFGVKNHGASQASSTLAANTWSRATVNFTTGSSNTSATAFAFRSSSTQNAYADAFFIYQPLTAPWTSADISTTGLAGIAGRLGEKFTLQASGTNLGGTADRTHFLSQPLTGDATITARILGVDTTAHHAKAGVMIRESTSAGARSASITWGPINQQAEFIRRSTTTATATAAITSTPRDITTPPWLRLTRRGNTFSAFHSPDGLAWTRVGSPQTIAMPTNTLIGIPACSGDSTRFTEALLDNLTITPPVPDVLITSPAEGTTISNTGQSLRLTASITSSTPPTTTWSKVSGPGIVTFENANLADTYATFSTPGSYLLRCAANTGTGIGSADLTVNIAPVTPADPSLALRLSLDESSGNTATDSAGKNLNATASGSLSWQPTAGMLAGAASFNGTDSHLEIPDNNLLDATPALTLSFWFRATTLGNNTGMVSKRVSFDNNNSYSTYLGLDGKLYVDVVSNNNRFASNTTFNSGRWYHIAFVFNGSLPQTERVQLYVNGSLDRTATETSTSIPNFTAPLRIGMLNSGGTIFDGLIDEIRIHRRALGAAEVLAASAETGTFGPNTATGEAPATLINKLVTLNGSATAEAGPAPTALWTKVTGPGNVVFTNSSSPGTTITFDQAGGYVLRLTSTNTNGETHADLHTTVFGNTLPTPEITITHPSGPVYLPDTTHTLHLATSVETLFVPGTPSYAWTQLSGPGTTTFANPNTANTTATFSTPGTYVLRCTVTNAGGTNTAQTTIAIASQITTTLRQGENAYSHAATFIRSDNTSWNSGARDQVLVGRNDTAAKLFRSVFSFPLTGIPSNATLTGISLDLWTHPIDAGTGSVAALELRELTSTPVEGTGSGSTATDGTGTGTTWSNRTQTTPWNTAGGDFKSTVLSSTPGFNATSLGVQNTFHSSVSFLATAQNAAATSAQLNLMLLSPSTESNSTPNFTRLASDDHSDPALRPRLNLTWTAAPAPIINPGPTPTAIAGKVTNLTSSVSGANTTTWSLVSGPGTATFADPNKPTTTVTFGTPGDYVIRLIAANTNAQVSRLLTIQAAVPPLDSSNFTDWQRLTWPSLSDPEITALTADPDLDGHNNLLEWALHLDPDTPDYPPLSINKIGTSLEFIHTRRKTTGASFIVEWSDTLENDDWSSEDVISQAPITLTATTESVLSTIPATTARRFVRLRIQLD